MIRRVSAIVAVALAAASLGILGCGGDEEETTKAQYLQRADTICEKRHREEEAKIRIALAKATQGGKRPSQAELDRLATDVALPPIREMVSELVELEAPSDDEERIEKMNEAWEAAIEEAEEEPGALIDGSAFDDAEELAGDYGLEECSQIFSAG